MCCCLYTGSEQPLIYTMEYCSPEVAQAVVKGEPTAMVHPAVDMWGLGVLMFELATGGRGVTQSRIAWC